ncbi:MAG: FHA domain-containing protein [Gemmatimonadaceae bacterium]
MSPRDAAIAGEPRPISEERLRFDRIGPLAHDGNGSDAGLPGGNGHAAETDVANDLELARALRAPGEQLTGQTVRFQRAPEQTVQFLPGRLEVVEGDEPGQDIRFVRIWGETPEITFGRTTGPRHRHVQLRSLTVSRAHARMRYEADRWQITNLSETNPTRVNSEELPLNSGRLLGHGDRIEMGEVILRFWEA